MANSLVVTRETTFGSNGIATIVMGPMVRGEVWDIEQLSVTATSVLASKAYVYRENISDSNLMEATNRGNADKTNTSIRMTAPELLFVQWRQGTPGARAMLRLEGKREL